MDRYLIKKLIWAMLSAMLIVGAIMQHSQYWETGITLSIISIITIYWFYSTGNATIKFSYIFIGLIFLFFYTIFTSQMVSRSALISLNAITSFLLACSLIDLSQSDRSSVTDNWFGVTPYVDILKIVLGSIVSIHAGAMIFEYLQTPVRVTGFLKDYSQASMCILIVYGVLYPMIKHNKFSHLLTLILFTAFFTSFSRSANFLLIIFFIMLFFIELKNNNLKFFITTCCIVLLSLALVYLYPYYVNEIPIDRSGLKHISSLNSRTVYWDAAWQSIKQNPLWGYGLGNYEWSGIKLDKPFRFIPSVHNDYLQIWLDLGIFWLLLILLLQVKFLVKHIPFKLKNLENSTRKITLVKNDHFTIAWTLLVCISLYMTINFIVGFLFFQILITLLICEVLLNEKAENS